ncbi:MAG: hypothetical protein ACO25L_07215, partial [Candidatus Nanopelagicales bacterium]
MLLKNKSSGIIGDFAVHQGDEWVELIGEELTNYLFQKAKETKKDLLLENYNNAIAKPHPIE